MHMSESSNLSNYVIETQIVSDAPYYTVLGPLFHLEILSDTPSPTRISTLYISTQKIQNTSPVTRLQQLVVNKI